MKMKISGSRLWGAVVCGLIGSNVLVVSLVAYFLYSSRIQYEARATEWTQNIAIAVDEAISDGIEKIDLGLVSLGKEVETELAEHGAVAVATSRLADIYDRQLPETKGFRVVNAQGLVIVGRGVDPAHALMVDDCAYFRYLRDHDDGKLYFSDPLQGRLSKEYVIIFARRYNDSRGRFAGVVFSSIGVDHFYKQLAQFKVAPRDVIALRDLNLGVIARYPFSATNTVSLVGSRAVSVEFVARYRSGASAGSFHTPSAPDNVERTATFRHLRSSPFVVNVSAATSDYLAPWRSELMQLLAMTIAFMLVSGFTARVLFRLLAEAAQREQRLIESEGLLNRAQQLAHVGSFVWDLRSGLLRWSDELFRLLGLAPDSVEPTMELYLKGVHPDDRESINARLQQAFAGERTYASVHRVQWADGSVRIIAGTGDVTFDGGGKPTLMVGTVQDVTEQHRAEDRIRFLATKDPLTGLPNRLQLAERAALAISLADRSQGSLVLMYIDLDRFKDVNDALGHRIGDALLVELACRIKGVLRDQDTASRQGGDEFVLLLPGIDSIGALEVARKVQEAIVRSCQIDGYDLTISSSIGIAVYPGDGTDLETLSKNADAAMYRAKAAGRAGFQFFTRAMQARSERQLYLVSALRHAVEKGELSLHFQGQFDLLNHRLIGAEALLRWHHPELGMVSPAEFIPAAEESGLIIPIGSWVIEQAARQARRWQELGHKNVVVAVNVSAVQFRQVHFAATIERTLTQEGLAPDRLELELTESVAMHNPQQAIEVMDEIGRLGVRISIDDFGTGYSSMSYLKRFQVYKLKIDQSFVRDIETDEEDRAIVGAIVVMARSLRLRTIAEGVETAEQLAFLRSVGCDEAQGYHLCRPMPAEQFEAFMRTHAAQDSPPAR
jgi:diguanylate cyclase (GGDEF)-like protein/PAS domain S-box-containing protein